MPQPSESKLQHLTGVIGHQALRLPIYLVDLTVFILRALHDWREASQLLNRATYRSLVTQLIFGGIDALPAITLLSLATGLGIVSQLIITVQLFGEAKDVITILTQLVALELGSLLTAMVLIGRSGSAIAVDLGNMKLNREIEGLELLGINVNHLFVTPRLLGTTIAQMVLAVYFSFIAVVSGVAAAGLFANAGYFTYLADIPLAFAPLDLLVFLFKNLVFGLLIGAIACFHGLRVSTSVTEVPQQAQRAIVNSLTIIFILNALIALTGEGG